MRSALVTKIPNEQFGMMPIFSIRTGLITTSAAHYSASILYHQVNY